MLKVFCSSKLICVLLLIATTGALVYSEATKSAEGVEVLTTVYVSPELVTEITEVSFTIDVNVRQVYLMNGYQIYLGWNPSLLNYTKVVRRPFLSNNSMYDVQFIVKGNNDIGILKVWEAQVGGNYGTAVGGNGTFFTVTFIAIGTGRTKLNLHETQLFLLTNEIQHNVEDGFFDNMHHNATWDNVDYSVVTESNSTVTDFGFNQTAKCVYFNVTGVDGVGYVNVTIPKSLLWVNASVDPFDWEVIADDTTPLTHTWSENATHSFVYFTYTHSEHYIRVNGNEVIPEFPQFMLPLILVALTMLILLTRKFYGRARGSCTVSLRKTA